MPGCAWFCLHFAGKALKCLPAALLFSQALKNLGDMLVLVMLESLRNQMGMKVKGEHDSYRIEVQKPEESLHLS